MSPVSSGLSGISDRHSIFEAGIGEIVHLPHITFEEQLHNSHALQLLQFPIAPAYTTTFNSCQGLTLSPVAIDLMYPVFSGSGVESTHDEKDGVIRENEILSW